MARDNDVMIEDAKLAFRNFAGKEDAYNRAGDRNFSILLEPETAETLDKAGWNVKQLKLREGEEDGEPQNYIQVAVSYKARPPRIVLLSRRRDGNMSRTPIDEDLVDMLDYSEIETVDVVLNPYEWTVQGKSGIKAYLKTMYATIKVDPLDLKYEDTLDSGVAG